MKISHLDTMNIDSNGFVRKKHAGTRVQLSSNQENNKYLSDKTPLERNSQNLSFKGVPSYLRDLSIFHTRTRFYDNKSALKEFSKYVGKAAERLADNIDSYSEMSGRFIIDKQQDKVRFLERTWFNSLCHALSQPFTQMPLTLYENTVKFLQKKNIISENFKGPFRKSREILKNDDLANSLNGYIKSVDKLKYDSVKDKASLLFNNAMKMFDPKSGNYNSVTERALTRIVTGFTTAGFLANDAYNLSRLCDDDPKAASKEKKVRFNQEAKRVVANSYIQLITLGALAKFVNKSKAIFVGTTIVTVVLTEAFSRLSNGRKIHFISKKEAIEINEKEKAQKGTSSASTAESKDTQNITVPTGSQNAAQDNMKKAAGVANSPAFKGSSAFKEFNNVTDISFNNTSAASKDAAPLNSAQKDIADSKESKPLITLNSVLKWAGITIAAGYALKYASKIKINKQGVQIGDYGKVISEKFNNFYKSITEEAHTITKENYNKLLNKLSSYDDTFAAKFNDVTMEYQKASAIKSNAASIAADLKAKGQNSLAEFFTAVADNKLPAAFKNISDKNSAAKYLKAHKELLIEQRVNEFFKIMENSGFKKEAKGLKAILINAEGEFVPAKFGEASKTIKRYAKEYFAKGKDTPEEQLGIELIKLKNTFENKFKINDNAELVDKYLEAMKLLKGTKSDNAPKYKNLLSEAANAEMINLGKTNKRYVKEIVDFLKEPFSFVWSLVKFPYTLSKKLVEFADIPLPKWPDEIKAISNGVKKLSPKLKLTDENFKQFMDVSINKSFNTITMSSVSNSDFSALSKYASTAATGWFLIADNHNMVMLKSNGDNKDEAVQKAKERALQETSRMFYNQLFINLFNNTFRGFYNNSLMGAQAINVSSTVIGEYINRKAIGMPVAEHSRGEILDNEQKNTTSPGLKGKFFRFMTRLTGKKVLSQREPAKKNEKEEIKK